MGLFSNVLSKIFGAAPGANPAPAWSPSAPVTSAPQTAVPESPAATAASSPSAAMPAAVPVVDVTSILDGLAAKNPEKLDWRKSIVDLMKLVGMDSSLSARKELAAELKYPGDTSDSAKMNVWLHKEVIRKLAENGGKVPADLLDWPNYFQPDALPLVGKTRDSAKRTRSPSRPSFPAKSTAPAFSRPPVVLDQKRRWRSHRQAPRHDLRLRARWA
jgi:hypothetical protein